MERIELDKLDYELIAHAKQAFANEGRDLDPYYHGVVAAARLRSGEMKIAFVVECENPLLGNCAEQNLISYLAPRLKQDPIETIVAVRDRSTATHKVIPPCGKCLEFIRQFADACNVIVPDGDDVFKTPPRSLLPLKYVVEP